MNMRRGGLRGRRGLSTPFVVLSGFVLASCLFSITIFWHYSTLGTEMDKGNRSGDLGVAGGKGGHLADGPAGSDAPSAPSSTTTPNPPAAGGRAGDGGQSNHVDDSIGSQATQHSGSGGNDRNGRGGKGEVGGHGKSAEHRGGSTRHEGEVGRVDGHDVGKSRVRENREGGEKKGHHGGGGSNKRGGDSDGDGKRRGHDSDDEEREDRDVHSSVKDAADATGTSGKAKEAPDGEVAPDLADKLKRAEEQMSAFKKGLAHQNTYDDVKLGDVTIVTAYYRFESKHSDSEYDVWMEHLLSVSDPMIIFTSPDLAPNIASLRSHAPHTTKVVSMDLKETLMATKYSGEFWKAEFDLDPEAGHHKSVELYWVWNEKANWLKHAVDTNPFSSTFFAWVDIGYLREKEDSRFKGKQLIKRLPHAITDSQVMFLNVNKFKSKDLSPSSILHDNRVGGNFIGGRAAGIKAWHTAYYAVMTQFVEAGSFIGKDQHMMASACAQHGPSLCFLVAPKHPTKKLDRVSKWFIIVPALHGEIPLERAWFPAAAIDASQINMEAKKVDLNTILDGLDEAHIASVHSLSPPADVACNSYAPAPWAESWGGGDVESRKIAYVKALKEVHSSHCGDFFAIKRSTRTISIGIRGRSSNILLQYLYGRIVADSHGMGLVAIHNETQDIQAHYPNFIFHADPAAPVGRHKLTSSCGPHFQDYRFFRGERCLAQCVFAPSVDGLSANTFLLSENDVVIHYRAPYFKFRGKSPHGITRENLSHTAPLYSYFARILERIKKRGKLGKVWILCDTGLHGDNVVDSLKKDYNAQIHGGSHHQDHYLGRVAPIFIGSFGTFTWTQAFLSRAREIHLPYVGIMKLGSSWNWWDALFIDDDPRVFYHDISGDSTFQSAQEVKDGGSAFSIGIKERDAGDLNCLPRTGQGQDVVK